MEIFLGVRRSVEFERRQSHCGCAHDEGPSHRERLVLRVAAWVAWEPYDLGWMIARYPHIVLRGR